MAAEALEAEVRYPANKIYWELGTLGVPFESIAGLMSAAVRTTRGFEPGRAPIPGTGKRLRWDPGTDGMDGWYYVEPDPSPSETGS